MPVGCLFVPAICMAERWKTKLKAVLDERGLDMKNVSLDAGLNASALSEILGKKNKDPSVSTLMKLVGKLQLSYDQLLTERSFDQKPKSAHVVGETAAGRWLEAEIWDESKYEPVPFVPTRYSNLEQRAYRVIGPSMDERGIHDGMFVITVQYWEVRTQPQDGDIVIVERRRDGGLVERTVKEIVIRPDRIELTPRSTDERYKEPFVIPRDARGAHKLSEHLEIEIICLVIGCYSPIG